MITIKDIICKTLDIPEDEMKYYIAMNCLCHSAIVWAGKADIGAEKICFFCGRKWVMDDKGEVSEC